MKLPIRIFSLALLMMLCQLLSLGASTASAQRLWGENSPNILALDGINGFRSLICPAVGCPSRTEGYLKLALENAWKEAKDPNTGASRIIDPKTNVTTVLWDGIPRNFAAESATKYLQGVKEELVRLLSSTPNDQIVIVAHSYGSAIAYQALLELEGSFPNLSIPLFITIGSPLGSSSFAVQANFVVNDQTPGSEFILANQEDLKKPGLVSTWINYFGILDVISEQQENADENYRLPTGANPFTAHGAYYQDVDLATIIAEDVRRVLDESLCTNELRSDDRVFDGFGASYDVLTDEKQLHLRASCANPEVEISITPSNESVISIEAGNGDFDQFIYREGYEWRDDLQLWQKFEFSGNRPSGEFFVGRASAEIKRNADLFDQSNFIVAYLCTAVGQNEFKCGCRDQACRQNFWQLQSFKRP